LIRDVVAFDDANPGRPPEYRAEPGRSGLRCVSLKIPIGLDCRRLPDSVQIRFPIWHPGQTRAWSAGDRHHDECLDGDDAHDQ
jgi:hypothetical protein